MNIEQKEVKVKCHNCKNTFPVAAVAKADELQAAKALEKKGGGALRVARWCPWCQETNMVEVPIEFVRKEIVFREANKTLHGLPPKVGEEDRR